MKTNRMYFILLICIATQISVIAKSTACDFQQTANTLQIQQATEEDVVIISEENSIEITGEKSDFILFSITKKIQFGVQDETGIKRISKFILPETFDPSYIAHFPKDRNYQNVYSNLKCNYFRGEIADKNGKVRKATFDKSVDELRMVMVENNLYGNFEKSIYEVRDLAVGDVATLEYNYEIRYSENLNQLASTRIFFNSEIRKENYSLRLSLPSGLNLDIVYNNDASPDSIGDFEGTKSYYWNRSNLAGCIKEAGSRPYLSLSHVIFSIKPYDLLYTLPNSFEEKFIPFYSIYSYQREKEHLNIAKSVYQGVKTTSFIYIDKFVNSETQDIENDSLGYLSLLKIQNTIADEFTFENDIGYFKKIDTRMPRMGEFLARKAIRDICRYDIYVALILKLDLNYFTAYLCDNRMGEISNDYFAPMYDSDYLFAVLLKNNVPQYIYPKRSDFGYYLNEVPFYFENTRARLVHLNDYNNIKEPINEELRQIQLPPSKITDNIRKSNVLVNINLETSMATFEARVDLSGQYSTMTRGLYQFGYKNETVNELYNQKISDLNKEVRVISEETNVINKEFPFSTKVKTRYEANNLITKNGDTYSLDLKNWFNHIIYNDFETENRQQDFYTDFHGRDTYVYFLQFNKNIKLTGTPEEIKTNNEFGELILKVEQIKPDAVKISSYFASVSDKVSVDKIGDVKLLFDKIQAFNNSSLKFILEN